MRRQLDTEWGLGIEQTFTMSKHKGSGKKALDSRVTNKALFSLGAERRTARAHVKVTHRVSDIYT